MMKRKRFVIFKVDSVCSEKKKKKLLIKLLRNEKIDIFIVIIFVRLSDLHVYLNKIFFRHFVYCIFPQSLYQRMQ